MDPVSTGRGLNKTIIKSLLISNPLLLKILFHNRSNIYWQRTEEQAVTSMGFGQAILLYELINRQVAARGRGLVVKVVDQQERWEQSQPYQVS